MRKSAIIFSLLLTQLTYIFGQNLRNKTGSINFFFDCRGDSVTIKLPPDFIGPKYDPGEEGPIVCFVAPDLAFVEVLCAGNTILQLNGDYVKTDSTKIKRKVYNNLYYSSKRNLYARELQTKKHFYMYSDASLKRKQELDKTFEILEEEENK